MDEIVLDQASECSTLTWVNIINTHLSQYHTEIEELVTGIG